jgi:hypothetical protein
MSITATQNSIISELLDPDVKIPVKIVLPHCSQNKRHTAFINGRIEGIKDRVMQVSFFEATTEQEKGTVRRLLDRRRKDVKNSKPALFYEKTVKSRTCRPHKESEDCTQCATGQFTWKLSQKQTYSHDTLSEDHLDAVAQDLLKTVEIKIFYDLTNGNLHKYDENLECTAALIKAFIKKYFNIDPQSITIFPLNNEQQPDAISSAPQPASRSSSIPIRARDLLRDDQEPIPASKSRQTASKKQRLRFPAGFVPPEEPPAKCPKMTSPHNTNPFDDNDSQATITDNDSQATTTDKE